ncbi:MAG TPA: cytochrome C oxidase subunit IV family protein [Pyrinomonadaceae bacterium]|nr:cytochrome C oxidase subunit IV family protein [Pyrinomonadaceae bacterium]
MADHDKHDDHGHGEHHIVSIPMYLMVFGILMVGTILTVVAAFIDLDHVFPGANTLVALLIATFKMVMVMLIFMHVKYSPKLIGLSIVGTFLFLAIMFAFTMQDYLTRSIGNFSN